MVFPTESPPTARTDSMEVETVTTPEALLFLANMILTTIPSSVTQGTRTPETCQSMTTIDRLCQKIDMTPSTATTEGSMVFMFTSTTALESHSMVALAVLTLTK